MHTLAKKEKDKDQESIQSQDTKWETDKKTIKHHIHESQDGSPFPAGDHKAAMADKKMKQTRNINNKRSTKKHSLGMVSKIYFYWIAYTSFTALTSLLV